MELRAFLVAIAFLHCYCCFAQTSTLNRPEAPMVLTGAELPALSSCQPSEIVGFKYESGDWFQIPIQVDERSLSDIMLPYGNLTISGHQQDPSNPKVVLYCDPNTNVGNDPNSNFDDDDELVFMLKDAGGVSDGSAPAGVVAGTCHEITLNDPLGGLGYVYVFKSDGSLMQDAGQSYVTYSSDVQSNSGFPAHTGGLNPETTVITTSAYTWEFSAEWVSDVFRISAGDNSDILDRHKNFFYDGFCGRHEDTFSEAENAFICVKAGPIRVLRSYMGANSGPLTQRTHFFYESLHKIQTDLRVHSIPAILDVLDYSTAANGMTYTNASNLTGLTIDGLQDLADLTDSPWEMVTGTQGTLSIVKRLQDDFVAGDVTIVGYYDDSSAAPASDCTGDGEAWGSSGTGIVFDNSAVCTDPLQTTCINSNGFRLFGNVRYLYPDAPTVSASTAADYDNKVNNPINKTVVPCFATASVNLQIEAFLQGAYDSASGSMHTKLAGTNMLGVNLLPTSQPFNRPPWNYAGTESVADFSSLSNTVDWILLDIREPTPPYAPIGQQAVLLQADGSIIDPVTLTAGATLNMVTVGQEYGIILRHRNHVDVAGNMSLTASAGNNYDFTNTSNVFGGGGQLVNLGNGDFGLYGGDYDGNGEVNFDDFSMYLLQSSAIGIYSEIDCDLDGMISVSDYNLYKENFDQSAVGQVQF